MHRTHSDERSVFCKGHEQDAARDTRLSTRIPSCIPSEVGGGLFEDVALLSHPGQFFLWTPDFRCLTTLTMWLRELFHTIIRRFGADPKPISHLLDRVTTLRDLRHRIDLELVSVTNLP